MIFNENGIIVQPYEYTLNEGVFQDIWFRIKDMITKLINKFKLTIQSIKNNKYKSLFLQNKEKIYNNTFVIENKVFSAYGYENCFNNLATCIKIMISTVARYDDSDMENVLKIIDDELFKTGNPLWKRSDNIYDDINRFILGDDHTIKYELSGDEAFSYATDLNGNATTNINTVTNLLNDCIKSLNKLAKDRKNQNDIQIINQIFNHINVYSNACMTSLIEISKQSTLAILDFLNNQ